MKQIRLYITENCNARCSNCFNKDSRVDSFMDIDKYQDICRFFSENSYDHIKIMGGEPTFLSNFTKYFEIAQKYFKYVSLFTNGINNRVTEIETRESDKIIYNFKFSKILTPEKLLLDKKGQRALEVQITKNTDEVHLFNEIKRVAHYDTNKIAVYFTLDCVSAIFEEREFVVCKYERLWNKCIQAGFNMGQDHIAPYCYVRGTKIPIPSNGAKCDISCAGLIDANYNIKFCNQYNDIIGNMFHNGTLINISDFETGLLAKFNQIQNVIAEKGCKNCVLFNILCNGGCFIAKSHNSPIYMNF